MIQINVVTPEVQSTEAYRVVPDPDDPVIFQIQDRLAKVLDISASGITTVAGELAPAQRFRFVLDLPSSSNPIDGMIETSSRIENGRIRCKFLDLTPDQIDQIHHYALARQKQAIRSLQGHQTV